MSANETLHHQPKQRNIFQFESWSLLSRSTKNANQNTSTGKCWTLLPSHFFPKLTLIANISGSNRCRKWLCCLSKRAAAHVWQLAPLQLLAHVCSCVSQLLQVSKHQKNNNKKNSTPGRTPHSSTLEGKGRSSAWAPAVNPHDRGAGATHSPTTNPHPRSTLRSQSDAWLWQWQQKLLRKNTCAFPSCNMLWINSLFHLPISAARWLG